MSDPLPDDKSEIINSTNPAPPTHPTGGDPAPATIPFTGGNGELPTEVVNHVWPEGCTKVLLKTKGGTKLFGFTFEPDQERPSVTVIHPEPFEQRFDRRFLRDFDGSLWPLLDGQLPLAVEDHDWPEGRVRVRFGRHDANTGKTEYFYGYILNDHPEEPFVRMIYPSDGSPPPNWYGWLSRSRLSHFSGEPLPPYEEPPKRKRKRKKDKEGTEQDTGPESAPDTGPESTPDTIPFNPRVLANFDDGGQPLSFAEIADYLLVFTGGLHDGWPKKVGNQLFIQSRDDSPIYLDKVSHLFGWMNSFCQVKWLGKKPEDGFQPREDFLSYLQFAHPKIEKYDIISPYPHWPPRLGVYYMHPPFKPNETAETPHLDKLLDFYCPATPHDRQLLKAAILTLFWGGNPGQRPVFLMRGLDGDEEGNRYIGKTKTAETICMIPGGHVSIGVRDDMDKVKTRFLSSEEGRLRRAWIVDNIKSTSWSWDELERFITEYVISGHHLYYGERQIPNLLTGFFTMNGGSFSKDLATRIVTIMLARPKMKGDWETKIIEFINSNRYEIIDDIGTVLTGNVSPIEIMPENRWGQWTANVLARCEDPGACQRLIIKRSKDADTEDEENQLIDRAFSDYLIANGNNIVRNIKLNQDIIRIVMSNLEAKSLSYKQACKELSAKNSSKLLKRRTEDERFWIWAGGKPDQEIVDMVVMPPVPEERYGSYHNSPRGWQESREDSFDRHTDS
jgi:hypothetical protein